MAEKQKKVFFLDTNAFIEIFKANNPGVKINKRIIAEIGETNTETIRNYENGKIPEAFTIFEKLAAAAKTTTDKFIKEK